MILLADHGLAASTTAIRVAAATRVDPLSAVLAGIAVFPGIRHGGLTQRLQAALSAAVTTTDPVATAAAHLRSPDGPAGFGLPQYPAGDPRCRAILELLDVATVDDPDARARHEAVRDIVAAFADRGIPPPNVDFGLGAIAAVFDLVDGASETLFLLARLAGWIAHGAEQYHEHDFIRPRGVYVGPEPS